MATYGPVQLPAYFSTSADFRAWGSGIAAALAACGLVNTADTGQINWATVVLPGLSTPAGYEIYRFSDALQATAPFFFKIEYGTGNPADRPALWLTVGTATNGAGTISAQASARVLITAAASKSAGYTVPVYASGDGSRLALCFGPDPSSFNAALWWIVERTRDASGGYTADGVLHMLASAAGGHNMTIPASAAVAAPADFTSAASGVPIAPVRQANLVGSDAPLGTVQYTLGGKPFYALSVVEVNRVDVGSVWGASFAATVLGAAHTFVSLLVGQPDAAVAAFAATAFWGLLWE